MLESHSLEPLICEAVTLFWEQGDLENTTFSCNHSWAPGQQGINSNPKHFISFSTFWRVFLGKGCEAGMWMCCSCGELGKQAACFPVEEHKSLFPSEGEAAETFLIPEASPGTH